MSPTAQNTVERVGQAQAFWQAPLEFAVHAVVGTSIFAIIAVVAVSLELALHALMRAYGVGTAIEYGLKGAEYSLFGTDLTLFMVFLWRTVKRTIRRL